MDYLNEYENVLCRKLLATGRSILDFNGEHSLNGTVIISVVMVTTVQMFRCHFSLPLAGQLPTGGEQ